MVSVVPVYITVTFDLMLGAASERGILGALLQVPNFEILTGYSTVYAI